MSVSYLWSHDSDADWQVEFFAWEVAVLARKATLSLLGVLAQTDVRAHALLFLYKVLSLRSIGACRVSYFAAA